MHRLFISLIFCILFVQNLLSSDIEVISNNTKQNIDNLSSQLKYFIHDQKENKKEINDILNLYYQHHERIIAFEIIYNDKYIYNSYKDDYIIFIIKNYFIYNFYLFFNLVYFFLFTLFFSNLR